MKTEMITSSKTAEICGFGANGGKMKIEQCAENAVLPLASIEKSEALSLPDGHCADPLGADESTRTPATGKEGAVMNEHDDKQSFRFVLDTARKPSVEIDTARYQAYLDDPGLSDDQKEEIIRALWSIIIAFVDLGFGVHPYQEVLGQEACGKPQQMLDAQGDKDSNEFNPVETLSKEFERASDET